MKIQQNVSPVLKARLSAKISLKVFEHCGPLFRFSTLKQPKKKILMTSLDNLSKALELAATSRHFESVLERFISTTRSKIEKTDSPVMKVIFGSATTEKENYKCTAFLACRRLFDIMVVRKDFKNYLKVTQFLIDVSTHSELSTWKVGCPLL